MNFLDWIKIVGPILAPMAVGFVWLGRKLEFVDELKAAKLPERVTRLEFKTGVQ